MLRRSITLLQATTLVAGIIIGASIFVQPSAITGAVPTRAGTYAVWLAAGLLTLFGALIAAELASAFPKAGGVYVFLREAWGPSVGFLWGWAMFWTMHTGIIAAIAMVFARYVGYFVPVGDVGLKLIAVGAVLALSAVNYFGVRQGSLVQSTLTIAKIVAIAVIIAIAFVLGPREAVAPAVASVPGAPIDADAFAIALVAALFAFGGWHMVTYTAEETQEAERTIRLALLFGVSIVTVCYIALNAAYFHVLPTSAIASSTRVAADAADAVLGRGGGTFMSALVVMSTLGAVYGIILAGPRVYLAMARDGLLWPWAGAIHPRFLSPHRAILLQAAWATVLVSTGSYRALFTRVVYTEWIFFALMAVGVMRLRGRVGYAPRCPVPGYPFVPIVFVVASLYVVANQIVSEPAQSLVGLLMVGAGWPIYAFLVRRPRSLATPPPPSPTHADRRP